MKNRIIDLILIVIIIGLFLGFFLIDEAHFEKTGGQIPPLISLSPVENSIQDVVYPKNIEVVNYSIEGSKIKLGFVNATATQDTLTVTLSISGIDISNNAFPFSELVCDPFIATEEQVVKTYKSTEGFNGDPIQITYVYNLRGNTYQTLHAEMDWTIGPCGTYLNGGQSNATPFPAKLLTSYHYTFEVPVN